MGNIGARERSKRRTIGFVALCAAVAVTAVLFTYDAPRWLRAIVFLPLWLSAAGFFQAKEKV